jgi:hypothetical protein
MAILEQLRGMTPERFLAIYAGLEVGGFGPLDKQVAESLRFRPQAVRKLAMAQRAKRARQLLEQGANAELAYEVFGAYLIRNQKELVTGFLDATGVPHQDGMIEDVERSQPDPKKIAGAVADLDARFPPEDVTLYLALATEQWPDLSALAELWTRRAQPA